MMRIIRDRYVTSDGTSGCDLLTGKEVALDPDEGLPRVRELPLPALGEALDQGRDGAPRSIVMRVDTPGRAATLARRAAAEAQRCGVVAMAVDIYLRFRMVLADALAGRTLLLIATPSSATTAARAAFLEAAASTPRPHLLLTFDAPRAARTLVVREARPAAYGGIWPVDAARYNASVDRARALAADGRHAAAERMMRESAAALARRRVHVAAAEAFTALGRLLLDRGRARDADGAFADAAAHAQLAGDERLMLASKLWQSAARCDAGHLVDAESLARAVLLTAGPAPAVVTWARAMLARVVLCQGRADDEAIEQCDADAPAELDWPTRAFVDAVAVSALLQRERLFEGGLRARRAVEGADASGDVLARIIAHTAHLRVLGEAGDFTHAAASFATIETLALRAHVPLRLAGARLIWLDALRRAGRHADADRQLARLKRVARVAPPLLRRAIERRTAAPSAAGERPAIPKRSPHLAVELVRTTQETQDDEAALREVLERVGAELKSSRLDLLSCDAGPVTTLLSRGSGLATTLGRRVLDAGIVIGPGEEQGGQELGVPVRFAGRLLAALVARWPLDTLPRAGAADLLQLAAALIAPRVEQTLATARLAASAAASVPELVGASVTMAEVRRSIVRAAAAPFHVLIEGESGVGKELAARAIHQLSPRRERRFCDINCAAIPEELLDAELFGHARGAFTGAVADRPGLFEDADGGTLFLDEVADLSARGQAKLLRVLQQHEVRRVGETFTRKIDVRLVAAANRDMRGEARQGRFRQDLLYRLDVIRIHVPALRERPEDIAALALHFWRSAASRVGTSASLTHGLLAALTGYHWPGNVRELQNVMAALAVAAPSRGRVPPTLLPAAITGATTVTAVRLAEARAQFERRCIEVALARTGGNRTRAAAQLGVTRQGLLKTMSRLGIEAK